VVQNLALGAIKLDMAVKNGQLTDNASVRTLQKIIDSCMHDVRNLCIDLSPPILYELGLVAAIHALGRRLAEEHGFQFHLHGTLDDLHLREDLKVTLFQMARELLINVVKHAAAANVTVRLHQEGGTICLSVADDGRGCDPSAGKRGFGLANIRNKADYLGGTVAIRSTPGSGTDVEITVPCATDPSGASQEVKDDH
jgi:signal transduction histidine kinase